MPSHKRSKRSDSQPARSESQPAGQELVITGEQAIQQAVAEAVSQQTPQAQGEPYEPPCTIGGLMAGFSGGMLGYVFGFGGHQFKHKGPGRLRASHLEGWTSARTFAIMGAIFAAASCFSKRLRMKDDVWNGVVAGASTGLVLGWKSGPMGALQSAFSLGAFSYVCDLLGSRAETRPAHAACLPQAQMTSRQLWHRRLQLTSQRRQQQQASSSWLRSRQGGPSSDSLNTDLLHPLKSSRSESHHEMQESAPSAAHGEAQHLAASAPQPSVTGRDQPADVYAPDGSSKCSHSLQHAAAAHMQSQDSCRHSIEVPSTGLSTAQDHAEGHAGSGSASAAGPRPEASAPSSRQALQLAGSTMNLEDSQAGHDDSLAAHQQQSGMLDQHKPCRACRIPAVIVLEALQGLQTMVAPGLAFGPQPTA